MGSLKISLTLLSLIGLVMVHASLAQNSPQDYLAAHNAARSAVGVGPLTWDNNVAAYAQNYANQHIGDCNLVHSGGRYGENLAKGFPDFTGTAAVGLWVGERANYDHNSNTCVGGQECRHYTQVVWRNSVRLGCGRVRCNDGWWFISCNYDPPGNFIGVGNMTWSSTVEAYAQNYANQRIGDCNLVHSTNSPYGENLAKGSSSALTGTYAVNLWVAEKAYYNYATNTCASGQVCGHYTQVVWQNSVRLGCARVQCSNGWYFVICSYDPPGNYVGQRPY